MQSFVVFSCTEYAHQSLNDPSFLMPAVCTTPSTVVAYLQGRWHCSKFFRYWRPCCSAISASHLLKIRIPVRGGLCTQATQNFVHTCCADQPERFFSVGDTIPSALFPRLLVISLALVSFVLLRLTAPLVLFSYYSLLPFIASCARVFKMCHASRYPAASSRHRAHAV